MAEDLRYQRYDTYLMNRRPIEEKLADAALRLGALFDGSLDIPISHSAAGVARVRAYLHDSDVDKGYRDRSSYVGVAQLVDGAYPVYVMEQCFAGALDAGRPVAMWWFASGIQDLRVREMPLVERTADAKSGQRADNERVGQFLSALCDIRNIYRRTDYEDPSYKKGYDFALTELQ